MVSGWLRALLPLSSSFACCKLVCVSTTTSAGPCPPFLVLPFNGDRLHTALMESQSNGIPFPFFVLANVPVFVPVFAIVERQQGGSKGKLEGSLPTLTYLKMVTRVVTVAIDLVKFCCDLLHLSLSRPCPNQNPRTRSSVCVAVAQESRDGLRPDTSKVMDRRWHLLRYSRHGTTLV